MQNEAAAGAGAGRDKVIGFGATIFFSFAKNSKSLASAIGSQSQTLYKLQLQSLLDIAHHGCQMLAAQRRAALMNRHFLSCRMAFSSSSRSEVGLSGDGALLGTDSIKMAWLFCEVTRPCTGIDMSPVDSEGTTKARCLLAKSWT